MSMDFPSEQKKTQIRDLDTSWLGQFVGQRFLLVVILALSINDVNGGPKRKTNKPEPIICAPEDFKRLVQSKTSGQSSGFNSSPNPAFTSYNSNNPRKRQHEGGNERDEVLDVEPLSVYYPPGTQRFTGRTGNNSVGPSNLSFNISQQPFHSGQQPTFGRQYMPSAVPYGSSSPKANKGIPNLNELPKDCD
ncbi:hypothetical protein niasHT_000605 [Heterodera trifolii]|uniref:Uncharacterized protein n=1 Tax=Heterodera trifolii TaxID=157864 RepID=A0ABD2LZ04_9BILA